MAESTLMDNELGGVNSCEDCDEVWLTARQSVSLTSDIRDGSDYLKLMDFYWLCDGSASWLTSCDCDR